MTERPTPAEVIASELFVTGRTSRSRPERILAALADAGYVVEERDFIVPLLNELRDQRNQAVRALEAITHGGLNRWERRDVLFALLDEPWVQEVLNDD